jgi:hypothetical protein
MVFQRLLECEVGRGGWWSAALVVRIGDTDAASWQLKVKSSVNLIGDRK